MFAAAVAALTQGVDALADIDPAGLGSPNSCGCSTCSRPPSGG